MARIELNQLTGEMTPEQKILVQSFYDTFDSRNAANRLIINVEPLCYIGASNGSEFIVYAATKMYICFSFAGRLVSTNVQATATTFNFYNSADAVYYTGINELISYNTTTATMNFLMNNVIVDNIYFSRVLPLAPSYIKFIGYRITLV